MGSLTTTTSTVRDWSSLPDEIWSVIGHHLAGDRFDATRFRSVCTSFRSLIPKFSSSSSLLRFSFSPPHLSSVDAFVSLTTVYKIRRPSSAGGGWIVKVEPAGSDRIRLLDSLSCRRISDIAGLQSLRLSEFQISELGRAYSLRYTRGSGSIAGFDKLVLSPSNAVVFVIYDGGRLGFAGDGDREITPIESRGVVDYNDITVSRGQPYVVDRWGTVSWIDDASMRLVQYSPPLPGDGARKHLVVSSGELFVVERYLEESNGGDQASAADIDAAGLYVLHRRHHRRRRRFDYYQFGHQNTVDFKVFKLDEEWGKWDDVKSLGKKSFILTYDCSFWIIADEFDGFEPNCIYFTEQFNLDFALRRLGRLGGCVFNMEDGTIEHLELTPGYSNIFNQGEEPTKPFDYSFERSVRTSI